eukprot:CAMPEP_0178483920 /NCGR_PEP_ID=MMETSP0696-20121128/7482_1 /TAXON_ID=265572 /ORGANISM="Extubocellulus spinifer, Strain CCMP396" /LENGTH=294 /DNA_ID=CAMNT_0020111451 /DNA_START=111 /DNA_END=995 /DNA_ORIENTATION=+
MIQSVTTSRGSRAALAIATRSHRAHQAHASNNGATLTCRHAAPPHESLSTLSGHATVSGLHGNSREDQSSDEAEQRRLAQLSPIDLAYRYSGTGTCAGTVGQYQQYHKLQTYRLYHATSPTQRGGPALALGLGAVAAVAKGGQYAARAFEQYKIEAAAAAEEEAKRRKEAGLPSEEEERAQAQAEAEAEAAKAKAGGADAKSSEKEEEGPRENVFNTFFNMGVGSKFYEGGFEEEMTRREAALILGVRESSTPKRIKEAHRKLLVLNHPDTGGSTYMAGKINEAKELLLKGRKA